MDVRADRSMTETVQHAPRPFWARALAFMAPFLVIGVVVGIVVILQATAPKPPKNDDEALPIAVDIATARAATTALKVLTQGEVKAKTAADLAAQVSGQIVFVSPTFEPGAAVRAGDLLARIDPASYQLALERSRSQVARAREGLARARSEAALAEEDWRDMGREGAPSELTLQKPQVAAAQADLRTAEAAVKESELSLQRTEIRAPFDGRISARRADVGDLVAPGALVASMFAVDTAQVRIPLRDEDLAVLGVSPGYVASGQAPMAHLSAIVAGEPRRWTGRLALIEASVDPATRLVYGLIEAPDPFGANQAAPLTPGLFVDVEIDGASEEQLVALPRSALKKNQWLYVVDAEGAIKARKASPAMADARTLYFRAGVTAGERVVTSYLPSPRDGMKVRDINAPAPPKDKVAEAKPGAKE
jgi:RND family efflux transporter MFP subunit